MRVRLIHEIVGEHVWIWILCVRLVRSSLEDLLHALSGQIIMSIEIENTLNSVNRY